MSTAPWFRRVGLLFERTSRTTGQKFLSSVRVGPLRFHVIQNPFHRGNDDAAKFMLLVELWPEKGEPPHDPTTPQALDALKGEGD